MALTEKDPSNQLNLILKTRIELGQEISNIVNQLDQSQHFDNLSHEEMAEVLSQTIFRLLSTNRLILLMVRNSRQESYAEQPEIDWQQSLSHLFEDMISAIFQEFISAIVNEPRYSQYTDNQIVNEIFEGLVSYDISPQAFIKRLPEKSTR